MGGYGVATVNGVMQACAMILEATAILRLWPSKASMDQASLKRETSGNQYVYTMVYTKSSGSTLT
jgi:hypothetical protein